MNNIHDFIINVKSSRKRTGIAYCEGTFNTLIKQLESNISDLNQLDCTSLYKCSLTFSAKGLLDQIEDRTNSKPTLVTNIETFIVSNSSNFPGQLAKLLIVREPLNPLIFLFYSKTIFRQFKEQYEAQESNFRNVIEL